MARKPIEYVQIEIDGLPVRVRRDQYVLWSAREAGFDIPHFCAHEWLEPFGGCRMCLVKVEAGGRMMPKLQTSCSLLPAEGMKVFTEDPEVIQARREQLEFHLLNHPLECPVCDKGGECMLQDQTVAHGSFAGRFAEQKRIRKDSVFNEYIRMNYKRCIHCKRCVHYCQDIDGSHLLKFVERGADTFIEAFPSLEVAPRFSGNVIDMCPVGALTARNYRFTMGRPWEQELVPSVGSLDSVGANIWLCGRLGRLARIVPRNNAEVEDGLIDDVTRFSWECAEDPRRVRGAIVRTEDGEEVVSRAQGEALAGRRLASTLGEHGPESVGVIAGGGLNTEEYLALRRFCGDVLGTSHYHFGSDLMGPEGLDGTTLHSLVTDFAEIADILAASTVLSIGCDLFEEAPALGLRIDLAARRGHLKLLSARSHRSDADRFADGFYEYGYGNLLRLICGLTNALAGQGQVPEEAKALAARLRNVGDDCAIIFGQEVWQAENPSELIRALRGLKQAIAQANSKASAVYLNAVYPEANSAGALLVNYLEQFTGGQLEETPPPQGSLRKVLQAAAEGRLRALVLFDSDLLMTYANRELVQRAINRVDTVIYCGSFHNPTSLQAAIHLPLATWIHREGTVVSLEWRVQCRSRALRDPAPGVLNIVNSLTALMRRSPVAAEEDTLAMSLHALLPEWPVQPLSAFPAGGVLMRPVTHAEPASTVSGAVLPPEVRGSAELPLVFIPKRFLYNDRQEIRHSSIFDAVARPFQAFVNPVDLKVHNLAEGDLAVFKTGSGELELPVRAAAWVRAGSVVANDYCIGAPSNRIAGTGPVRVAVRRKAEVRET